MASPPDSFKITIREVQFPPNRKFVRETQERILRELNSNRSQLIRANVWPVIEVQFPSDSAVSVSLPPGIVKTFWGAILAGCENGNEATISIASAVVARGERAKLSIGNSVWFFSVGDPMSDYISSIMLEGPKTFSVPYLESAGKFDTEIFHGMSIMMISQESVEVTRQVFITVDENNVETPK